MSPQAWPILSGKQRTMGSHATASFLPTQSSAQLCMSMPHSQESLSVTTSWTRRPGRLSEALCLLSTIADLSGGSVSVCGNDLVYVSLPCYMRLQFCACLSQLPTAGKFIAVYISQQHTREDASYSGAAVASAP